MESTGIRRHPRAIVSRTRRLVAVSLIGIVLAGAHDAAAMSLVTVRVPDGTTYTRIASQASEQDVTVSRSVGLMEGASADASATTLDGGLVQVSRSVGLMEGTTGTASEAELGYKSVDVSRSVGLMEGTSGTASQAALGSASTEVSRSVGLMEGART